MSFGFVERCELNAILIDMFVDMIVDIIVMEDSVSSLVTTPAAATAVD